MEMMAWPILTGVFLAGAGLAWAVSSALAKSRTAAAEARVGELRQQVESAGRGFDGLRQRLEGADAARITAEARVEELQRSLAEERVLLEEAKQRLSDTFKSLAAEALAANNVGFLALAEQRFSLLQSGAASDLEARKQAVETLVGPLNQAVSAYQEKVIAVGERLASLRETEAALQTETAKLVNALRSSNVRGRWGEIALRKTAELAGMQNHCDFIEQETVATDDQGRLRPDMIVKLPADRVVIVDSKVPLEGYLESLEAKTDDERRAALTKYAAQVNRHVAGLADKAYWNEFPSAEFVVLFIPSDSFLAAAAEQDPGLIEAALARKIVIATPSTFIALLRAIAYGWRQESLAENAQKISALGQELSDRIATWVEHIGRVGSSLEKAVESFNAAAGSLEARVLPSARKFKELGVGGKRDIEALPTINQAPRRLSALGHASDEPGQAMIESLEEGS